MGRRVAFVGIGLVVVGIAILVWGTPAPEVPVTDPIDHVTRFGLGLLLLVAGMAAWVGSIMIGLAIVARATGGLPVSWQRPVLLWWALAGVVLASLVEIGLNGITLAGDQPGGLVAAFYIGDTLRTIAAVLVACWLSAALTGAARRVEEQVVM